MQSPLGQLAYLYIGTAAFERDVAYYRDVLGAEVVWAFAAFKLRKTILDRLQTAALLNQA